MSIAFEDLSTAEQEQHERSYQAFVAALDLRDKIRDCVLFPPEFDFTEACPCAQCASKTEKLKEFEIQIKSKKQLVMKHGSQMEKKELLCLDLSSAVWRSKRMLDRFHRELKAVSEKSGVALTHEKSSLANNLLDLFLNMQKMLEDSDIVEKVPYVEEPFDERYDVFMEIEHGCFYYGQTRAKDTAVEILNKIEKIQIDHDKEKEDAVAQKKVLDPSISKNYIERQIELVTKLPVQELKFEFDELIFEIHPRDIHQERKQKALEFISDTCCVMIIKMKEFWKESPKGNEHISNGWEQFFDSLINEVKSFEEEWKKDYAPFYTPHDRSDPKRHLRS